MEKENAIGNDVLVVNYQIAIVKQMYGRGLITLKQMEEAIMLLTQRKELSK